MIEYLAPILMAVAAVIGAVGVYLKNKAGNTVTYADGWERYAGRLEIRVAALEKQFEEQESRHDAEIKAKNTRITELEARVATLEHELSKQLQLNDKVDEVKGVLHETVEQGLEGLKDGHAGHTVV